MLGHGLQRTAQPLVWAKPGGSSGQLEVSGQSHRRLTRFPVTGLKNTKMTRLGKEAGGSAASHSLTPRPFLTQPLCPGEAAEYSPLAADGRSRPGESRCSVNS